MDRAGVEVLVPDSPDGVDRALIGPDLVEVVGLSFLDRGLFTVRRILVNMEVVLEMMVLVGPAGVVDGLMVRSLCVDRVVHSWELDGCRDLDVVVLFVRLVLGTLDDGVVVRVIMFAL